jgi:hypothetical protein
MSVQHPAPLQPVVPLRRGPWAGHVQEHDPIPVKIFARPEIGPIHGFVTSLLFVFQQLAGFKLSQFEGFYGYMALLLYDSVAL